MGSKSILFVYTFSFYLWPDKKNSTSKADDITGRKKGFAVLSAPNLLIIGGLVYIILELVNTAYAP
jgi:hypothetical protein